MSQSQQPPCPYCGAAVTFHQSSAFIYRGTDYGSVYACSRYPTCDAFVGCHKGATRPLGRLADPELREWRSRAHVAFDPLWTARMLWFGSPKHLARNATYWWLADRLIIAREACHIASFDVLTCQRVVAICEPFRQRLAAGEPWSALGISRKAA